MDHVVVASSHQQLDRRSLEMHRLIAAKIRAEPELFVIASRNIERWSHTATRSRAYLDEWSRILSAGMAAALAFATEDSEHATELRQSTPFAGVLSAQERWEFLKKWKEANSNI